MVRIGAKWCELVPPLPHLKGENKRHTCSKHMFLTFLINPQSESLTILCVGESYQSCETLVSMKISMARLVASLKYR